MYFLFLLYAWPIVYLFVIFSYLQMYTDMIGYKYSWSWNFTLYVVYESVKWIVIVSGMFVACSLPSHYLNQYQIRFDWNHWNKFQGNLKPNTKFSFQENAAENVFRPMVRVLLQSQCVIALLLDESLQAPLLLIPSGLSTKIYLNLKGI